MSFIKNKGLYGVSLAVLLVAVRSQVKGSFSSDSNGSDGSDDSDDNVYDFFSGRKVSALKKDRNAIFKKANEDLRRMREILRDRVGTPIVNSWGDVFELPLFPLNGKDYTSTEMSDLIKHGDSRTKRDIVKAYGREFFHIASNENFKDLSDIYRGMKR